jgi:hypothetical protein
MLTNFRNRLCVAFLTCAGMGISMGYPTSAPAAPPSGSAEPMAVAMVFDFNTTLYIVWHRKGGGRWLEQRCGTGAQGQKTAQYYVNLRRQGRYEVRIETRDLRP